MTRTMLRCTWPISGGARLASPCEPLAVARCRNPATGLWPARYPRPASHPRRTRPHTTSRRPTVTARASFLPEPADAFIRNSVIIGSLAGISYSVLVAAATAPPPKQQQLPPGQKAVGSGSGSSSSSSSSQGDEEGDNFVWGAMGAISFLPLFGWLSWVFGALTFERRAALYGIYAALYSSPLLLRGLDWQDPWVLGVLALGVVHVQLERIAQTEPDTLAAVRPLGALGGLLRATLGGAGAVVSGLGGAIASDARRAKRRPEDSKPHEEEQQQETGEFPRVTPLPPRELGPGRNRPLYNDTADVVRQDPRLRDPELDEFAARELLEFDRQLKERKGSGQGHGRGQQRGRGTEGQERGQAAGDRHKGSK